MKLVNMKMSKKEAKDTIGPVSTKEALANAPRYPYGLEIRLDTETLKKLGINLDDYKLGETCVIEARAQITDKGEHQRLGGEERINLELQITDLAIGADKKEKKKKAEAAHLNDISAASAGEYEDE